MSHEIDIDKAVAYNKARPYQASRWKLIQAKVGTTPDGIPGEKTVRAVADWQANYHLTVDGMCGRVTLWEMRLGLFDLSWGLATATSRASPCLVRHNGKGSIDADGSPRAYNPYDTGIDALANAGRPGNWWGLHLDSNGDPVVQGDEDPFPGYYVSTTALNRQRQEPYERDVDRYIDSMQVPYIALPRNLREFTPDKWMPSKGDLCSVSREVDGMTRTVWGIYADVGPSITLGEDSDHGELSIAAALALNHDPFQWREDDGIWRARIGITNGLTYRVWPGTAGQPGTRTLVEVTSPFHQRLAVVPE